MMIAAMLAMLAMTTAPAAARDCLSLQQVKAKHPGQHPRYRSVQGRQCWYVGKTPDKSEFRLPPQPAPSIVADKPRTTAVAVLRPPEPVVVSLGEDDEIAALVIGWACGEYCTFESRWRLR
jgi:hypothetical protein